MNDVVSLASLSKLLFKTFVRTSVESSMELIVRVSSECHPPGFERIDRELQFAYHL